MHGRISILIFGCLAILGCRSEPAVSVPQEPEEQEAVLAKAFDPGATGTIQGRVIWDGDLPVAKETVVRANAFNPNLFKNPARFSTPHVPKVHPQSHGVENAVVFLRGVDSSRSKPWVHTKVRVEFSDRRLVVQQGETVDSIGFVERGAAIEIVNRDAEYHNLHGRGAAFFAQPLLQANRVHQRKLTQAGVVELTCAAGYYWMHAHLFVADHPYYARTDADGRFTLDQVPAGTYELVCWLPNWHVLREQRDPETGIVARLTWAPAQEQTQKVRVEPGRTTQSTYRWSCGMFERKSGAKER